MSQLDDPKRWLIQAQYFNRLWHSNDDYLRENETTLDESTKAYYQQYNYSLLNQKQNCQLTALRLAVANNNTEIILELDPHEKGIHGEGIFYSLYPQGEHNLGCHIPKHALMDYLTTKQLAFFQIY